MIYTVLFRYIMILEAKTITELKKKDDTWFEGRTKKDMV
jgi:hypothetical protein